MSQQYREPTGQQGDGDSDSVGDGMEGYEQTGTQPGLSNIRMVGIDPATGGLWLQRDLRDPDQPQDQGTGLQYPPSTQTSVHPSPPILHRPIHQNVVSLTSRVHSR